MRLTFNLLLLFTLGAIPGEASLLARRGALLSGNRSAESRALNHATGHRDVAIAASPAAIRASARTQRSTTRSASTAIGDGGWFVSCIIVLIMAAFIFGCCILTTCVQPSKGEEGAEHQAIGAGHNSVMFCAGTTCACWLIVVTLFLLYSGHALGHSVKYAVETRDEDVLGVNVHIGSLQLNPLSGVLTVHDVLIENPEGYKAKYILTANRFHLDVHMLKMMRSAGKLIEVSVLHINGLRIVYEQTIGSSNVQDLTRNIKKRPTEKETDEGSSWGGWKIWRPRFGPPEAVVLHEVDISDISVKVMANILGFSTGATVPCADVSYDSFSESEGVNTSSAVSQALIGDILTDTVMKLVR